jgi:hypothetical protein
VEDGEDSSHLVAQALGGNDGNLIADALVGLEVESQLGVVTLNDDLGGLLDSLGTNATHFCGMWLFGGRGGCRRVEVVRGAVSSKTRIEDLRWKVVLFG